MAARCACRWLGLAANVAAALATARWAASRRRWSAAAAASSAECAGRGRPSPSSQSASRVRSQPAGERGLGGPGVGDAVGELVVEWQRRWRTLALCGRGTSGGRDCAGDAMPRGRDAASGARSRHVGAHRIRGNGVREKRQSGRDGVAHCVHVGADHRRGLRVGVGGAHVPCRTSRPVLPASTGHRRDRCPRPVRGHRRHDTHRRAGRVQPRAATGRLLPRRGDHDGGVPDLSPHLRHGQSRPTDQSRHRLRHRDPITTTPLPSLVIQARWWVVRGRLVHHAGRVTLPEATPVDALLWVAALVLLLLAVPCRWSPSESRGRVAGSPGCTQAASRPPRRSGLRRTTRGAGKELVTRGEVTGE